MNCTKCGKEIPEGENKICDECQKKLLEDIVNEEKNEAEEKVENTSKDKKESNKKENKKSNKENKEDTAELKKEKSNKKETKKDKEGKKEEHKEEKNVTENKKEENKEDKEEKKEKKEKNSLVIVICIAVILIALLIAILIDYNSSKGVGNTIGNIRNYGYTAIQGDWIYYLSPNEDSSDVGICKIRKDGTDKQTLLMYEDEETTHEIVSINVSGNYIYYIEIATDEANEEDPYDNKIYRMKTDGSDREVINDNEINNDCYEIYVVDGFVYYIDLDANVAKMKLDGSNKTVVAKNGTGYLGLTKEYIVFNKAKENSETEYITYIMDINGENERQIIKDKRLYSVNIEDGYVYYTNDEKKIYRTKIDSNVEELVCDTEAYNLNVNNGYAYYLNYLDAENEDYTVCIFKTDVNPVVEGQEKKIEKLKSLDTYSSFLNVAGEWALYMDSNETRGVINMVKTDGSEEIVELYSLDFEKYYDSLVSEDTTNTTEENTVEATNTTTDENVVTTNTVVEENTIDNTITENTTESTTNTATTANVVETNTVVEENDVDNTTIENTTSANITNNSTTVENVTNAVTN